MANAFVQIHNKDNESVDREMETLLSENIKEKDTFLISESNACVSADSREECTYIGSHLSLLSRELIEVQEQERKRLAAELHDGLCQLLGVIKYKIERLVVADEEMCSSLYLAQLKVLKDDVCGAMDEVRKMAAGLRPSVLDDLGLVCAVSWLCREFGEIYNDIVVEKRVAVNEHAVADHRKLACFRIIQEAMTNVSKHANATRVFVELESVNDSLLLRVSDNGRGFDVAGITPEFSAPRLGVRSMRERAYMSGGILTIESSIGGGTTVRVKWPE